MIGIAFFETSAPILTTSFLKEFLLKVLGYGLIAEFLVIGWGSWVDRDKNQSARHADNPLKDKVSFSDPENGSVGNPPPRS